jgi:hypothetical protein
LIRNGAILSVEDPEGSADITIETSPDFWEKCFELAIPQPGYESLTMAMGHGLTISGAFASLVAVCQGGLATSLSGFASNSVRVDTKD